MGGGRANGWKQKKKGGGEEGRGVENGESRLPEISYMERD